MKVIQISDTHLFADDELEIFGAKTNLNFVKVISRIIDEEIHDTDLILLTGDLSQDETIKSYQKIAHYLSELNVPIYWILGNHDDSERSKSVFQNANNFYYKTKLTLNYWHFIFLNTKIDGRNDGYLSKTELKLLKDEIIAAPVNKKIAIVMHHHPAPVDTPFIDKYILENNQNFWNLVTSSKVELIICGHVHGDYSFNYNNCMIETSPATCLQFEKGSEDLKIEMKIGYKIYYFNKDGYTAKTKMW